MPILPCYGKMEIEINLEQMHAYFLFSHCNTAQLNEPHWSNISMLKIMIAMLGVRFAGYGRVVVRTMIMWIA